MRLAKEQMSSDNVSIRGPCFSSVHGLTQKSTANNDTGPCSCLTCRWGLAVLEGLRISEVMSRGAELRQRAPTRRGCGCHHAPYGVACEVLPRTPSNPLMFSCACGTQAHSRCAIPYDAKHASVRLGEPIPSSLACAPQLPAVSAQGPRPALARTDQLPCTRLPRPLAARAQFRSPPPRSRRCGARS